MSTTAVSLRFVESVREAVLIAEWVSAHNAGETRRVVEYENAADSQMRRFVSTAIAFAKEPERISVSCRDLLGGIRRDDL